MDNVVQSLTIKASDTASLLTIIILLSLSLWYATGATGPLSCKSHWNSHEANDNSLNEKLNWCYAFLDGCILELNCSFSFLG